MIKKSLVLFVCFFSVQLVAQRTSSSPYSFFGLGDEFNPRTVEQSSMGGIGVAYDSPYHVNLINPAALASLKYSTYIFGLNSKKLTVADATTSQSSSSSGLNYFGFATYIGDKVGITFGLQPLSSVGYSLRNTVENANAEIIEFTQFTGEGGINRLYGGVGVKVLEGLSLGLEADFIFGRLENNVLNQRADVFLGTKNDELVDVRGGKLKIGALYKRKIKEELQLNVGASVELAHDLEANGEEHLYSLTVGVTGVQIPRDTIYSSAIAGKFESPLAATIGVGLGKENKWYAGLEYRTKDAIKASGYSEESASTFRYDKSSRISLGGFYLPKITSIDSYWERVTYRAGLRYENVGLLVNGTANSNNFTAIKDFGINFGVGLPLRKQTLSNVNIGFEYGKRGTKSNNLLQENYFNLRVSLSLNDIWYKKRKID